VGVQLKDIGQQVLVITGASSGIGLTTARMAADQGAKLVLSARSEDSLQSLVDEINANGGEAIYVAGDVANEDDMRRVAQAAIDRFGGFDTWVNNAGVSIYGRIDEVSPEDHRRLFDTNFWGVVNGSLAAVEHLKNRGGALINIGSTLSDRAIPIQGMYSASKHAVKGFTDAFRMELEEQGAPISVTLIKPAAINTPYPEHAKNYLPNEPTLPAPVYAPEVVAETIIHCAQNPVRDAFAGGGGKAISLVGKFAPRTADKVMEWSMRRMQQKGEPARNRSDNSLHKPSHDLRQRGKYEGHVSESSAYTKGSLRPILTGALVVGAGVALASLLIPSSSRPHS
jgi:NADP-dependent 3-hydroxy acid dehydrogenase YdfG